MGEKLIEMWERDVGRNREKMPEKKRPIQKMCWRKLEETLFPFSPYSGYKLYFTSFGVKSPWGGGPSHHYYVSTVFKVPKNQLTWIFRTTFCVENTLYIKIIIHSYSVKEYSQSNYCNYVHYLIGVYTSGISVCEFLLIFKRKKWHSHSQSMQCQWRFNFGVSNTYQLVLDWVREKTGKFEPLLLTKFLSHCMWFMVF